MMNTLILVLCVSCISLESASFNILGASPAYNCPEYCLSCPGLCPDDCLNCQKDEKKCPKCPKCPECPECPGCDLKVIQYSDVSKMLENGKSLIILNNVDYPIYKMSSEQFSNGLIKFTKNDGKLTYEYLNKVNIIETQLNDEDNSFSDCPDGKCVVPLEQPIIESTPIYYENTKPTRKIFRNFRGNSSCPTCPQR